MRCFDTIELVLDVPEHGLKAGTIGAIVDVLQDGQAFFVEFFDDQHKTLDVVVVTPEQIRVLVPDFFLDEPVALTQDVSALGLQRGLVGKVVQRHVDGMIAVAFGDRVLMLPAQALLLLVYADTPIA
jgi:hypothetical protein